MSSATKTVTKTASWGVLGMLAMAQFILVLDTTVMNVSISQVAEDLNTTIVGMQTAITFYTLVMASFMLLGGKLGDRWGGKKAFVIGLLIYGVGSLTTALAPNITVLLIGWSFIEGFGAVLVIPALVSITAITYSGKQRAVAYGLLGGVCGASAALGPLIGGLATTYYTWRIIFAAETVIVLILMLFLKKIPASIGKPTKMDTRGAVLSAAGFGLAVFGILRSAQWGWITPSASVPTINGVPLTPLGLSPVFWLIIAGVLLLRAFAANERKVAAKGEEPLLDLDLLNIPKLRAGLTVFFSWQFIIMATFFVIPLYLQTVLGFDAMQTGLTILPLSLALFVMSLVGSRRTGKISPKRMCEVGLASILIGEVLLIAFTGPELRSIGFKLGLLLIGAGLGLMASQLSNVNMSSVPSERGSEVGGLQGTSQNLGASLGTALIGSILIASLVANYQKGVLSNPALTEVSQQAVSASETNPNFVTTAQFQASAEAAGLTSAQTDALVLEYADAQVAALKASFAGISLFALLALYYVRHLPKKSEEEVTPVS